MTDKPISISYGSVCFFRDSAGSFINIISHSLNEQFSGESMFYDAEQLVKTHKEFEKDLYTVLDMLETYGIDTTAYNPPKEDIPEKGVYVWNNYYIKLNRSENGALYLYVCNKDGQPLWQSDIIRFLDNGINLPPFNKKIKLPKNFGNSLYFVD